MRKQLIRGQLVHHARGRVFTELHDKLELSEDGFSALAVSDTSKLNTRYFHFDNRSLEDVENEALELWLHLRELRKQRAQSHDNGVIVIQTHK